MGFYKMNMKMSTFLRINILFSMMLASLYAESRLQLAWNAFDQDTVHYVERGLSKEQILQDALGLASNDPLSVNASQIFLEILDGSLCYLKRSSEFEVSEKVEQFRKSFFSIMNKNSMLKQKCAQEIFKEYKSWGIVISSAGTISRVDIPAVVGFVLKRKGFLEIITNSGTRFATKEKLLFINALIDSLALAFKENIAQVIFKKSTQVVGKSLSDVAKLGHAGLGLAQDGLVKVQGGLVAGFEKAHAYAKSASQEVSVTGMVKFAGSVSAIGLFVGMLYVVNNRREIARNLLTKSGGPADAVKKAISLYSSPKTRMQDVASWVRSWAQDDPDYRMKRAQELTGFETKLNDQTTNKVVDPLTAVLLHFSRNPELVDPEHAEEVAREMAQNVTYHEYLADKKKGKLKTLSSMRSAFKKAAATYRSRVGDSSFFGRSKFEDIDTTQTVKSLTLDKEFNDLLSQLSKKLDAAPKKYKVKKSDYRIDHFKNILKEAYDHIPGRPGQKSPQGIKYYIDHLKKLIQELDSTSTTEGFKKFACDNSLNVVPTARSTTSLPSSQTASPVYSGQPVMHNPTVVPSAPPMGIPVAHNVSGNPRRTN